MAVSKQSYLVRVSDQQCSLLGEVVVNIGNYLHSDICFASTRRTDNLTKHKKRHFRPFHYNFRRFILTAKVELKFQYGSKECNSV